MSDVTQGTADTTTSKRKVADHWLIDAAGTTVEKEEEATGIGYKLVDLPGKPFIYQIPGAVAGSTITMQAVFGCKTLATNESSQVRHNPKGEGTADEQLEAVRERFALMDSGVFVDRTRDGVGVRIDLDMLSQASAEAAAAKGGTRTAAEYRAKFDADAAFLATAKNAYRNDPALAAIYNRLAGRTTKSVDDLLNF